MAFEAEHGVSLRQQFLVHGTMRVMTDDAAFPKRLVLEDVGAALSLVTGLTVVVRRQQGGSRTRNGVTPVRFMTGAASDAAFDDGVAVGKSELSPQIGVADETALRIPFGIDD